MTTFPSDEIQARLAEDFMVVARHMTVGFLKFPREDASWRGADPAGTGTLVRVGSIFGVLTASHVLHELPGSGSVGLVRITNRPDQPQKATIDMSLTERVVVGKPPFGSLGPDLGFLRLPDELTAWLDAKNGFLNLEMRRREILSHPHAEPHFDALIGVVDERTRRLPGVGSDAVLVETNALFTSGSVVRELTAYGLDLLEFQDSLPPKKRPNSYQGTSGGGLWRMYLDPDLHSVRDRCIVGVAIYEFETDGRLSVTCHGPRSIYGVMIDAIRQRWPGAAR